MNWRSGAPQNPALTRHHHEADHGHCGTAGVADLDKWRRRRASELAFLHLSAHRLVSADVVRVLGLTADDVRRLRRCAR